MFFPVQEQSVWCCFCIFYKKTNLIFEVRLVYSAVAIIYLMARTECRPVQI